VGNLVDRTATRFGRFEVAVNNEGTEHNLSPVNGESAKKLWRDVRADVLRSLCRMKPKLQIVYTQVPSIFNISLSVVTRGAADLSFDEGSKDAV
jgi:hypothetical protein